MFSRRIQQRARQLVALLIRPLAGMGVTLDRLTIIGLFEWDYSSGRYIIGTRVYVRGGLADTVC